MTVSWRAAAVIVAAAVGGGLLSLRVYAFHQFHPTPVGLAVAYAVGALVCGAGSWGLLLIVGRVRLVDGQVREMADPREQDPLGWIEPRLSQEVDQ